MMALHSQAGAEQATALRPTLRYIAKQPILDAHEHVCGYELLFRDGPQNLFSSVDANHASLSTMDYSLAFGTGPVAGEKLAFVNCTRELLVTRLVTLLPSDKTVLEILEDVAPDLEVLEACRHLSSLGYRFALDDFLENDLGSPFLEHATFVKVDIRANSTMGQARIARELARRGLRLLAEKVETREEFDFLHDHGYQYFQGYFFCRPIILQTQDIPAAQLNRLRLLQAVSDPSLNLKQLEEIIRPEVSLSYRLLRYLNSAAFGLYPVRSVMHALTLLGEREVRKWIALVTAGILGQDKTPELVRIAVVRAKFCESFAPSGRSEHYFLTGLFSLLDAMLDRPMSQLASELPISGECRTALLRGQNFLADLLRKCEQCERGEFDCASTQGEPVCRSFRDATLWADAVLEVQ
ncbi:MAG: EAL domain-containing protein [Terriglobia bacterium]|jgi:EAL and modified HD-GYP domain-containing signal transduction protein|nr:EAL domain-containing protein [Terriglobia bacterium]